MVLHSHLQIRACSHYARALRTISSSSDATSMTYLSYIATTRPDRSTPHSRRRSLRDGTWKTRG
eukprot:280611-Pleurochrysis_carterae.AAC.1